MKLGITAGVYRADHASFAKEIERLKELGYDCIDYQGFVDTKTDLFQMDEDAFLAYLRAHREIVEAAGLCIHQTHGPWQWPVADATEECRAERFEKMSRSIRGTAVLGARYMVIHNLMPFGKVDTDGEVVRTINKEFFTRLCRVGEENGVIICLENMPFSGQVLARPADTLAFVKELNTPWMRMCLDVGHCTCLGISAADAVRMLGTEYLLVMHVHDNNGEKDRHWLPFTGVTDWADFSAALGEIGFEGVLSIESVISKELEGDARAAEEQKLFDAAKKLAADTGLGI